MKNLDMSDLKNINFSKILKPLAKIGKQHYFIVSMLLILVLAAVVYTVTQRVNTIEAPTEEPTATTFIQFDKQTINELEKIGDSSSSYSAPTDKRISPFAE